MAEAGSTRTHAEKGRSSTSVRTRQESQQARSNGMADDILALQRSAGNRAVGQLLQSGVASAADPNSSSNGPSKEIPQRNSHGDVLTRATHEPSQGLDKSVRVPMEHALGANLSGVRVHSGVSSRAAAESLGARAYTVGSDIYLGSAAQNLNALQRNRLLAHEAVHTIQQGGRPVALQGKMEVSQPGDSAEVEADKISKSIISEDAVHSPSLALGLRDQLRATPITRPTVSRVAAPLIQRDLKKPFPVDEGTWTLDLADSIFGTESGLSGTIKFKANSKAPDADKIRILQAARIEDLSTGKDFAWSGAEAARSKIMSPGGTGMGDPGYFVDVLHKNRKPRSKKGDADVSPYYIDDYLALADPRNADGSKKGKAITDASIYDFPKWNKKSRFSFETVAKDPKAGHVFGSVAWGFTISDPAKNVVDHQWAYGRNVTLKSTDLTIASFEKHYKNKGTPGAP